MELSNMVIHQTQNILLFVKFKKKLDIYRHI